MIHLMSSVFSPALEFSSVEFWLEYSDKMFSKLFSVNPISSVDKKDEITSNGLPFSTENVQGDGWHINSDSDNLLILVYVPFNSHSFEQA